MLNCTAATHHRNDYSAPPPVDAPKSEATVKAASKFLNAMRKKKEEAAEKAAAEAAAGGGGGGEGEGGGGGAGAAPKGGSAAAKPPPAETKRKNVGDQLKVIVLTYPLHRTTPHVVLRHYRA